MVSRYTTLDIYFGSGYKSYRFIFLLGDSVQELFCNEPVKCFFSQPNFDLLKSNKKSSKNPELSNLNIFSRKLNFKDD